MPFAVIVLYPSSFLDCQRTLDSVIARIGEAAAQGAQLVVFSEACLTGYPSWIWRLRPGTHSALLGQLHGRLRLRVTLDDATTDALCAATARHGVTLVCGIVERQGSGNRCTMYNSVVVIGPQGAILNCHRKLVPTNAERTVWGYGDGQGLKAVETDAGRLGALICRESYLPLARSALAAEEHPPGVHD